jgi:endonuclease YncB( thermonuclease family)
MRRLLVGLALGAALLGVAGCGGGSRDTTGPPSATGPAPAPGPESQPPVKRFGALEEGVVARINDGDTITLADGRTIRLVQIDAPELGTECYGEGARREAEKLMPPGTRVTLQRDPLLDDRDAYGRLLRYVEANRLNMNAELVVFGAAVPYFFRGERGRYAADLLTAVETAQAERVGLWKACPGTKLNHGVGSLTGPG